MFISQLNNFIQLHYCIGFERNLGVPYFVKFFERQYCENVTLFMYTFTIVIAYKKKTKLHNFIMKSPICTFIIRITMWQERNKLLSKVSDEDKELPSVNGFLRGYGLYQTWSMLCSCNGCLIFITFYLLGWTFNRGLQVNS